MVYQGPMDDKVTYTEACERLMPQYVKPPDHILDLVTPGISTDAPATPVQAYRQRLELQILKRNAHAYEEQGLTVQEMLLAWPGAKMGKCAMPFFAELGTLLQRKLAITMQHLVAIAMPLLAITMQHLLAIALPLLIPTARIIAVDVARKGIDEEESMKQISLVFDLISLAVPHVDLDCDTALHEAGDIWDANLHCALRNER